MFNILKEEKAVKALEQNCLVSNFTTLGLFSCIMKIVLIIIVVESVGTESRLCAGPPRNSIPASAQTPSQAHPVPYPIDAGLPFHGAERLGRENDRHLHLEHKVGIVKLRG
jgi:hypothetical protein